jgi:4-amino-4-deoxy-L-arabinose transferase-like glycosyltransferase
VWATDSVLKHVIDKPAPERALLSTQLANALAATLLVIPAYLIGRMLFGRNTGFAAALLFQVLPVPARITSDGLTEGVYLLVTASAIMLGVRAVRRPRISGFLLCGLAIGASYLVRPEGLMIAAGPGAVALWLGLTRRWPRDAALGRLTALCIGVALVSVPYMALIGALTQKTSPKELLNPSGPPRPIVFDSRNAQRAPTGAVLFAEWWNDERDSGKSRELWAVQAVLKEMSKSANYVVWPLALFAMLALRRRFATEPALWVPLILIVCNVALLIFLAARVGYVSERHTMLLTLLACQFAAAGLPLLCAAIGQLLPSIERFGIRVTAAGLLVALIGSSLPFALKPMHAQREAHRRAGEWLAQHVTDQDGLVDPFCWAEWYAGRTLYRTTWNPPESRNTYIVWENEKVKGSPHSRLPVLPEAKRLKDQSGSRIVYHWPEDVPQEQAHIHVYKLGPD